MKARSGGGCTVASRPRRKVSYSDDVTQIASKKKSSGAVDIQSELLGVFWFTYFNAAYVAFFGEGKFNNCPGVERSGDGSITIVLSDSPTSVTPELRERAAAALCKESFVNPRDILGMQRGRSPLTFLQLRAQR